MDVGERQAPAMVNLGSALTLPLTIKMTIFIIFCYIHTTHCNLYPWVCIISAVTFIPSMQVKSSVTFIQSRPRIWYWAFIVISISNGNLLPFCGLETTHTGAGYKVKEFSKLGYSNRKQNDAYEKSRSHPMFDRRKGITLGSLMNALKQSKGKKMTPMRSWEPTQCLIGERGSRKGRPFRQSDECITAVDRKQNDAYEKSRTHPMFDRRKGNTKGESI